MIDKLWEKLLVLLGIKRAFCRSCRFYYDEQGTALNNRCYKYKRGEEIDYTKHTEGSASSLCYSHNRKGRCLGFERKVNEEGRQ